MTTPLFTSSTITINTSASKIWNILTAPESLQQVMMGMKPFSDWKVGSPLLWIGRHSDKPGDNAKGFIQVFDANKELRFTFYFPGYGYPDKPEYYNSVRILITEKGNASEVQASQGDFSVFKDGETYKNHSQTFWDGSLKILKELAEKGQ